MPPAPTMPTPCAAGLGPAVLTKSPKGIKKKSRGVKTEKKSTNWFLGTGQALGPSLGKASSYRLTQEHFAIHRQHFPAKRIIPKPSREQLIKSFRLRVGVGSEVSAGGKTPLRAGAVEPSKRRAGKDLTAAPDAPSLPGELGASRWSPTSLFPCSQLKCPSSEGGSCVFWP